MLFGGALFFLGIFMIKIKCVVFIFIVLGTLKEAYDIKK